MKLQSGDIFEFSINDRSTCYGQIISTFKKDTIAIIVFEGLYKSRPDIEELLEDNILLFGNTFDAKFYHKNWIVIANEKSNLNNIKLPYYKIGTDPVYIEDFFENRIRKANANEEENIYYRSYVAPIRFETALKAYYKIVEWNDAFDDLLYSNILRSINLIEELK
jgi:hypothetical protein